MLFVRGEEMGNYRNKVLCLLIGFFLFFGFSEFGMAAAAKPIKLCYSTTGKGSGTVAFSAGTVKNKCATYASVTSINRPISFRTQLPKYIYPHTRYRAI